MEVWAEFVILSIVAEFEVGGVEVAAFAVAGFEGTGFAMSLEVAGFRVAVF